MTKGTLALILVISASLPMFSQKNMEDVIHLKNGSEIHGTIVEWKPDSIMKVEIAGGSLFVFKASEIQFYARIEKKKKDIVPDAEIKKPKTEIVFNRGIRFNLEGGWIIGSGDNQNKNPFSIHTQCMYHLLPTTSAGLGIGFEFFSTTRAPLYADVRQYLNKRYYAPYIFFQSGWLIPIGPSHYDITGYQTKSKPGYMVNPGFGFLLPLGEKCDVTFSISYRYQKIIYAIDDYYKPNYERIEKMNRLNLKIGFSFH
jgi:hypothetical protein